MFVERGIQALNKVIGSMRLCYETDSTWTDSVKIIFRLHFAAISNSFKTVFILTADESPNSHSFAMGRKLDPANSVREKKFEPFWLLAIMNMHTMRIGLVKQWYPLCILLAFFLDFIFPLLPKFDDFFFLKASNWKYLRHITKSGRYDHKNTWNYLRLVRSFHSSKLAIL